MSAWTQNESPHVLRALDSLFGQLGGTDREEPPKPRRPLLPNQPLNLSRRSSRRPKLKRRLTSKRPMNGCCVRKIASMATQTRN